MASFDPSVIGGIADSGVQSQKDAYTLYDDKNRVQLNSLNLQNAKEEQTDHLAVKKILQNSDLSTEKGVNEAAEKASKVSPELGMKLKKDAAVQQGMNLDNEYKKMQNAQEQVTPLINSIDATLGGLQKDKEQFDKGQITKAELDGRAAKAMLPQILSLKMEHPELSQYLDKFLQNPQGLTYQSLVSAENQTKNGRDMAKQRSEEIKTAQNQYRLEQGDKRLENQHEETMSLIKKRDEDEKDKESKKLDPDTAKFIAKQYVDTGDKSVFTGLGRSAGDMAMARKAVREYAESIGMTPAEVSAKVAEFNGYLSEERALGNRQAAIDSAASEAGKVIPIAKKASDAVPREKWVPVNKIIQAGKVMTSDKDLAKFGQANLTMANVYSRAMNPTGAATVSGRDHALEMLGTATSQDAYNGVLEILAQEIDAAKAAPPEIRKEVFNEIATGKASHETIMGKLFPADKDVATPPAARPGQKTSGPVGLTAPKTAQKPKSDDELLATYGSK